jgi:hypothetical protein
MVHADHVNSWWGVELLIPLLKHTKYYYFCELSMIRRPMPTWGIDVKKVISSTGKLRMLWVLTLTQEKGKHNSTPSMGCL